MKKYLIMASVVISVGIISFWLSTANQKPTKLKIENFISINKPIPDFVLQSHTEAEFNKKSFANKWSLVFFGYTNCPDICPTTMNEMKQVKDFLAKEDPQILQKTQFIFVSVDPKRDSVKHLKDYVTYFDKDFIGVTGNDENINVLVNQLFGVYIKPDTSKEGYLVDHSGTIHLVAPSTNLAGIFKPPIVGSTLAKNYLEVVSFYESLK